MGRFHVYAHDKVEDGILQKIKSDKFITSTSVTLSPSRHILWEAMFASFGSMHHYQNNEIDPPVLEKVLVTNLDHALEALNKISKIKNPFILNFKMEEWENLVNKFRFHVMNRLNGNFLIYNISEVIGFHDEGISDNEILLSIAFTLSFYSKILTKQPFDFKEALYALSGTVFSAPLTGGLITIRDFTPTLDEYYNIIAGVEDM